MNEKKKDYYRHIFYCVLCVKLVLVKFGWVTYQIRKKVESHSISFVDCASCLCGFFVLLIASVKLHVS